MQPDWQRIEVENPGLSIESSRFLGEGWNVVAYLVNDEFVFKFPKRAEIWEELEREITVLAFAADRLPLAVPRYGRAAPESPAAAHGYVTCGYLPGEPMDIQALTLEQQDAAAGVLATFLQALHRLDPSPHVKAVLPCLNARDVAATYCENAKRDVVPHLSSTEARALIERFERYLDTPQNFAFEPTVLHADLSAEHILVQNGSVVAALDFGSVHMGDPDYDFMKIFLAFGPSFTAAVARRYGHPDLEQLGTKLRYFAVLDQVRTILDGAGLALDGQQDDAWDQLRQLLGHEDRL